ncbi:MAG: prenyltransferase/squalene oxidase repeat-containing protein [Isosphaeraceae bacterium]|nr:prenyltransferase/squalene oxidase repeat-containing protein [Isosphaeraceae bacterium]
MVSRLPELGLPSASTIAPPLPLRSGVRRGLDEIPSVYRSRLDPNRTKLAQESGASEESEQAVERALDWLSRHQDADGRWDGGTARYKDGSIAENDDDYLVHCPAGDLCFGPCYYWEADTALTGLSLLAFLGSGYTHVDGKYASTVAKGLDFLRSQQKPDGDLRGRSVAVGMYCHAIATLALSEAYALTGEPALRVPVERALSFLVRSRAVDGRAWRYAPSAPVGDTSILGWVVMALKSGKENGMAIEPRVRSGIAEWLGLVSAGPSQGMARYQPNEKVTPTMTAEAWVCRQFLGLDDSPSKQEEAARYLLSHPPKEPPFNLYYIYYGTLAMYQRGGPEWTRWNREARDLLLLRQRRNGHATGSWDPDDSQYGTHGGRIYCTALAALSLEVYYRYLRLYEPRPNSGGSVR